MSVIGSFYEGNGVASSLSSQYIQHRTRRIVIISLALASLLLLGTAGSTFAASKHSVTLNVDGVVRPVNGWATTVNDVLSIAKVDVKEHDIVVPEPSANIHDGQTITVRRSHHVWVDNHGSTERMWVAGQSILELAQTLRLTDSDARLIVNRTGDFQLPISVYPVHVTITDGNKEATVNVPAGTSVAKAVDSTDMTVNSLDHITVGHTSSDRITFTIVAVSRQTITEEKEIPFETTEEESDDLYEGEKEVTTEGKNGIEVFHYAVTKRSGTETNRTLLQHEITTEPVDEVVKIGTKKLPAHGTSSGKFDIPSAPANPNEAQRYARSQLASYGFTDSEFGCLVSLWTRESGWSYKARNSSSGAYGIPQALPGTKMASAGADWRTNPHTQIRWGLGYIKGRYGTPCQAWNFFLAHNMY
ncbi:MAG: G5 domain-containing protein [Actinomycetaceae bacterium]|nr:G5 domain-containing protein [Actinomycetaceae bacterium]